MPKSSPVPDRVRLDDLTDLASAVPHMLGFYPNDSLVVIALRGPRERLSFTMRLDLPDPQDYEDVAHMTAVRMDHAQADAVMLFVYTDATDREHGLPQRDLVNAVADALSVPLREALLIDDGRLWSYLCADERCCPAVGRLMRPDSPGALALAAANALHGNVVLPDRDALVATTVAIAGVAAESMLQAIERVDLDDLAERNDLLDELCERISDSSAALSHDDAAVLVLRLHDIGFRDEVISRLAARDDTLERLVADVARLAQPPYDAPAAAVLAMSAYLRGDGVVAGAAAERALDTDPSYSLAQLVLDSLARQLDPAAVREVWLGYLP
jgi:uncharacterized protein DUF4192